MATMPELIYCANGNKRYAEIAIDAGFTYGAQMPGTVYFKPEFIDLHPERPPDQWTYNSKLRRYRPRMATVHDWHSDRSFDEIMLRADDVSQYVESVIIIPKVSGTIPMIPRRINGRRVVLGFSVPTRHGKTDVPMSEFSDRPIHLLGGQPHVQMELCNDFNKFAEVVSVDCNYHLLKANRFCEHWESPGRWIPDNYKTPVDANYSAFRASCANIIAAWREIFKKGNG